LLNKKDSEQYKSYIKTSAVGLEVAISIIFGSLAGYFFDKKFHSAPFGLLAGLGLGVVTAARILYLFSKKWLDNQNNRNIK
jgi:F0F1-type ATP synthase assembly protein I